MMMMMDVKFRGSSKSQSSNFSTQSCSSNSRNQSAEPSSVTWHDSSEFPQRNQQIPHWANYYVAAIKAAEKCAAKLHPAAAQPSCGCVDVDGL